MPDSTDESNGGMKHNFTIFCVEDEIGLFERSTTTKRCQLHKLLD
jgi:hypothetical protein